MYIKTAFNDGFIELIPLGKAEKLDDERYLLVENPEQLVYNSKTQQLYYIKHGIHISLDEIFPENTEWLPELAIAAQLLPRFKKIKDIYLRCIKHKLLRPHR